MPRKSLYLLVVIALLASSCKKTASTAITTVTYVVDLAVTDSVAISYYSDYYFASGELKSIKLFEGTHNLSTENEWYGFRLYPNREEGYYIKVDYLNTVQPANASYGVRVYMNDTTLLDSYTGSLTGSSIELSGQYPG